MAKIKFTGLEDIETKLLQKQKKAVSAVPKMVMAGGKAIEKAQREESKRMFGSDRSTGDLSNSIQVDKTVKGNDRRKYVKVFPRGKDRFGVRNATKGFVLQYGRRNMPAKPWLTSANAKGGKSALEAMRKAWDDEK